MKLCFYMYISREMCMYYNKNCIFAACIDLFIFLLKFSYLFISILFLFYIIYYSVRTYHSVHNTTKQSNPDHIFENRLLITNLILYII